MYRNTTSPPRPLTLASGRPLAPGEDGPADNVKDAAAIAVGDLTYFAASGDPVTPPPAVIVNPRGLVPTSQATAGLTIDATDASAWAITTGGVVTPKASATPLVPTTVKTAAYTAVSGDLVPVNAAGGAVTVTLPSGTGAFDLAVKKLDTSTNAVTIAAPSGQTFNTGSGNGTLTLSKVNRAARLVRGAGSSVIYVVTTDIPFTEVDALSSGSGSALTRTAVKTSSYSAAAGDLVPCDPTNGPFAITLPTAPADRSQVAVKIVTAKAASVVTVACGGTDTLNRETANPAQSMSLRLPGEGVTCLYDAASKVWTVIARDTPLTQLDQRYRAPRGLGDPLPAPVIDAGRNPLILAAAGASSYNAFPGVGKLDDGRGIAIWRKGTAHASTSNATVGVIMVAYTTDESWNEWTAPVTLLSVATRDLRDTAVAVLSTGRIVVTYTTSDNVSANRLHSQGLIYSDDRGATWSAHREDYTFDTFDTHARSVAPIVELPDGSLLWPIKGFDAATATIGASGAPAVSAGVGLSANGSLDPSAWTFVKPPASQGTATGDFDEPWIVRCANGSLLMSARDNINEKTVFLRSTNNGASWSVVAGASALGRGRPSMLVESTGRVLLAQRRTTPSATGASTATLYYSDDSGNTWGPNADASLGTTSTGISTDDRFQSDNATKVLFEYAQMVEVKPGLICLLQGIEQASGAEMTVRWIFERAGIAPGGDGAPGGDVVVPGKYWNEPQLTFISPTDGTRMRLYVDSRNRLRLRSGFLATSETSGLAVSWLRATVVKDWASLADGAAQTGNVTVTGAALGDAAIASMDIGVPAGVTFTAVVSNTNVVTVTMRNNSGAAVDLASANLTAFVLAK